jgi:hypothetical protein
MALSLRHRAALALTGALISAPLWACAAAAAATSTVTFTGAPLLNLGAVSCPSKPNVSRLTVAAGTQVNFANRLGKPATLWAGDSHKHLQDGEMVPVTFTSGPATIVLQMLPDCSLDLGTHGQMTVVVDAPAQAGQPIGGTLGGGGEVTPPVEPTGPGDHGTTSPESPKPGHSKSPKPVPDESGSTGPGAVTNTGDDGTSGGTDATGSTGDDNPFATPSVTDVAGTVRLGDPVGASAAPGGASGLLTLIATVCVVGVSAAAIRAIIAQRATRALTS